VTRYGIEKLLSFNKYLVDDEEKHITIKKEICAGCRTRPCIPACPAGLYVLKDQEMSIDPAGCLECGTCRVVCPFPEAIDWNYPRGGFGISYRYG
jgi:ferredoxin like protein